MASSTGSDAPHTSLPFPKRDVSTLPQSSPSPDTHQTLRQATLILPDTGDRVKRSVTLRDPKIFGPSQAALNASINGSASTPSKPASPPTLRARLRDATAGSWTALTTAVKDLFVSRSGQGVLKCSLAYFVATMAVFLPYLTPILGAGDGKHLVANIVIWFHPARSEGSMDYGIILGFCGWLYGASIAYASMAIAAFFRSRDMLDVGHAVVLVVCAGGGMGLLAWYKQYRNDPLVNVSCSVAALPIVTALTKDPAIQEGFFSHRSTTQVLTMMFMAILITVLINYIVLPIRGHRDLKDNLIKATNAYATMLAGITASFLSGIEDDFKHPALLKASDDFKNAFSSLSQNLTDAKFEHHLRGNEKKFQIEERLVKAMQRLSQDIGGLRSAASIQFWLLSHNEKTPSADQSSSKPTPAITPVSAAVGASADDDTYRPREATSGNTAATVPRGIQTSAISPVIRDFGAAEASADEDTYRPLERPSRSNTDGPSVSSAAHIFATFIEALGPPMKSLAYTLNTILTDLPLGHHDKFAGELHPHFRPSLASALELFAQARSEALNLVYKSKELTESKSEEVAADFEEVASSCGHFSSSLQDLGEGVLNYLDTVHELEMDAKLGFRGLSWNWLVNWAFCLRRTGRIALPQGDHEAVPPPARGAEQDIDFPLSLPSLATRRYFEYTSKEEKPAVSRTLRYKLWKWFHIFRRDDIRFAIKVGSGAVALISLAYIPATKPTFHEWRLEWCIATYMFVCAMSIGAANAVLLPRIRGTFMGAFLAVLVWIPAHDNAPLLAFLCWLVSLYAFYTMLVSNQAALARFMLLTFNLSVLYSYSLSINDVDDDPDDDRDEGGVDPQIWEIVFHRLVAVAIGVLCGLFVTQAIWPISARRKLKAGLGLLWLRMGLIWKRAPLSVLIDEDASERPPSYMDIREETKLREWADTLDALRKAAESEFALRGPFMTDSYDAILKSTGRMLDGFHALSVVTSKDAKATRGEQAILRYTTQEREQLAKRISHLFYVLASSVKLQFPLGETLPNIQHTRDRLLAKVHHFRQDDGKQPVAKDEDFEILYAYSLVTAQIANEIDVTSKEIEKLYGYLDENMLKLE